MTLYLVVVGCPNCDETVRFVEESDDPIDLMQDVPLSVNRCPYCAAFVPEETGEWDVQEESEVERVVPTQERGST